MHLKKLKEQFIERKFQKKLISSSNDRKTSHKIINSVAILTSEEIATEINLQEQVEAILNLRNCKIFKFRRYNKLDDASYHHFSEKDFNWQGKISNINFKSFLEQDFDLLISFFDERNLYLEFGTLYSNANFKVGFSEVNQALFNIEIAGKTKDCSVFLSELKNYLKILKKLEN